MDIRGGGDGGTSHTKNPNQIFPIIYTLSSKYLYLSLSRFSPMVRTLFTTNIDERNVSRQRRKQQVVEINDSDPSEKPFSCCYSFILPGFARPCYRHVIIIYIRDAVPTFSRFLFRCRRNFVREPPFLRPTPNLAHARFVPPSTELLPAEEVTGSNYRKITDYLFQGRSIRRKQE